jgi:hypothetical protein
VRTAGQEEVRCQGETEEGQIEEGQSKEMMLALIERLNGWRGLALTVVVLALGASGTATPARAAEPAWKITMTHANPYGQQREEEPCKKERQEEEEGKKTKTEPQCGLNPFTEVAGQEGFGGEGRTFARESGWNAYTITVENTGTAKSEGKVTVTDKLPAGFAFGGTYTQTSAPGWFGGKESNQCKILPGGAGAECFREEPLEPHKPYKITLYVEVAPEANNPSVNVAEVKGGGAPAANTGEEGRTTVTQAVPFGIDRWSAGVKESLGNPFSQAGGHPFSVETEVVFNYTTGQEVSQGVGVLAPAGGPAKEVFGELPPGFIGNPLITPRCPLAQLRGSGHAFGEHGCPANTAVGFTRVILSKPNNGANVGGAIAGGKPILFPPEYQEGNSSLIYNLEPPPGSPAEFGFTIAGGLPFLLEAKLRSDGDYGVSVGDSAIGERPIATQLTFCANGATAVSEAGLRVHYDCNEAPASTQPFLSNPTNCPSSQAEKEASRWALTANPWANPTDHVSTRSYVNAEPGGGAGAESFPSGCEKLKFEPEVQFKQPPSSEGGTTQADEPSAMSLALTLLQTDEASLPATPALKNLVTKLPAGLTASPSAANGLGACSRAQVWPSQKAEAEEAEGKVPAQPSSAEQDEAEHREPAVPGKCPPASQIGTFEVFTPVLSGAPSISGEPLVGNPLTCSSGNWTGSPALSYQWLRNGKPIGGATNNQYTVVEEDDKKPLQCQVTASTAGGRSVAISRDAVAFKEAGASSDAPFPPSSVPAPKRSAGNTLTCEHGAWSGSPVFHYTWLRGGEPVPGATEQTSSEYVLGSADEGKLIQCQVIGENASGTVIADSAVVVVPPAPSVNPPLPGAPIRGQVYLGQPECAPCTEEHKDASQGRMLKLFLEAKDPLGCPPGDLTPPCPGVLLKLHGTAYANEETGQLETRFENQPQAPLELLNLKLNGGPTGQLATPTACGKYRTYFDFTPYSSPFTADVVREPEFEVTGCGDPNHFAPSFNAGVTSTQAGAFTNFPLTFGREDREAVPVGLTVNLPLGLVGRPAAVEECGEAEVRAAEHNAGECPAESQVGTAEAGAGPGPDPFYSPGKVYFTGPYKGQPFGLAVITHAVAGPFDLGNIVVRSAIAIDPHTAAVSVTSDPLPQIRDGVPLRLRNVHVEVNRPGFTLNPTNCAPQQVSATITASSGVAAHVSNPFDVGGCANLPFSPELTAVAGGHGSKFGGTSFTVKVKAKPGQANIRKTFLQLPIALPSRLDTIQKACVASVFEADPAACDEGSNIGMAIAHTPLLKSPLAGPAYLVSHGNAAFPDVEFVLQGEGVTLILDGKTDIKKGITYSRFETVPDAPVTTFETVLPAGPHSALTIFVPGAQQYNLCSTSLVMPTEITGQNGAVIKKNTKIAISGCAASKPKVSIAKIKVKGNALLVTVRTSAKGRVRISGKGLKTTMKKNLAAGTHRIRVPLTKKGRSMRRHHKKTKVRVSLTVGKQAVAKTRSVRL